MLTFVVLCCIILVWDYAHTGFLRPNALNNAVICCFV